MKKEFSIRSFIVSHAGSTILEATGKVKSCDSRKAVMVGTVKYLEMGEAKTSPTTIFELRNISNIEAGKYYTVKSLKCAVDGEAWYFDCSSAFVFVSTMPEQDTAISSKLIRNLQGERTGRFYATSAEKQVIRALSKKLGVSNRKQRAWDDFKAKVLSRKTVSKKETEAFGTILLSRRFLDEVEWQGRKPSYEFFLDIQFLSNLLPQKRDHLAQAYLSGTRQVTCTATVGQVNEDKFCCKNVRLSDGFHGDGHCWVKWADSSSLKKGKRVRFQAQVKPYFCASHGTPRLSYCLTNPVML